MSSRLRHRSLVSLALLVTLVGLGQAEPVSPRGSRPTNEIWSDGPTLVLKLQVLERRRDPGAIRRLYQRTRLRQRAIQRGHDASITVNRDLWNYLSGANGQRGVVDELRAESVHKPARNRPRDPRADLPKNAAQSRARLRALLDSEGFVGDQRHMLAELMLWRGLAYGSGTLAHGSDAPLGAEDEIRKQKARDGLRNAVAESFVLGERLGRAAGGQPGAAGLNWFDIENLHRAAVAQFPEKEPGQVRWVNFDWPVNSFGVNFPLLHGDQGMVARFDRFLRAQPMKQASIERGLRRLGDTLYFLHNAHPFRDGNGRTQVLLAWSVARAAGFPVPIEYDQSSAEFKLAAAKMGGTPTDLRDFLASGAVASERFVNGVMPLLRGKRIVSTHTDQGAVATVVEPRGGGKRSLLVMFPVTHARQSDAELELERAKERPVLTGDHFDPVDVKIQVAVNGKHTTWHTVSPAKVHGWNERYPWWTTVEPIYQVDLPHDARYVDFRIVGPGGTKLGSENYYMNLNDYQNISQRARLP